MSKKSFIKADLDEEFINPITLPEIDNTIVQNGKTKIVGCAPNLIEGKTYFVSYSEAEILVKNNNAKWAS